MNRHADKIDADFLKKILSRDISEEERDLLCAVAYGRPFAECVGEIRRDNLIAGINSGRYTVISVTKTHDVSSDAVEIRFICAEYGTSEMPETLIYEYEGQTVQAYGTFSPYPVSPPKFTARFETYEIDSRFIDALRKWSEIYGLSFAGILNIVKPARKP